MKSALSPVCRMGRSPAHADGITSHYQHGQKFAHPDMERPLSNVIFLFLFHYFF